MKSLKEYVLASQREPRLEQFLRQPGGEWLLREAAGLEARMELPSLSIALCLVEVYARVELTRAPLRPQIRPPG